MTLPRLFACGDLVCHNGRIVGAVSLQRQIDVNLGTTTLWLLAQSRPQKMNLWSPLSDQGLRMQLGAASHIDLAGRLVHALLLMPFMIMDLRVPTNGTVVATDASVHGQGVCRTVGFAAAGELEAKRLETQLAQRWDNCIGLVDMLGGLSSWRAAFDELGIQPAIFAFVGGRPTANRIVTAAWPDVFVLDSPSSVTSHWMRQVMDFAPSVTHWCLGRRCLDPADAQDVTHWRNLILQHGRPTSNT